MNTMLNQVADGVRVRQSAWVWSNAIAVRGEGGLSANIAQFENTDTTGKAFEMSIVRTSGRHQIAIRRTVNRILLIKWGLSWSG